MQWTPTTALATALLTLAVTASPAPPGAEGCTVAVVSGKATPDGRPLLWKNRDSGHEANRLVYVQGDGRDFLAVVNAEDEDGVEVWAGVNSAGFCIMNSASYNLYPRDGEEGEPERRRDEEGHFMRAALARCATVEDFQLMLEATVGDRGVQANFGVIDAAGGAALFETANDSFERFDATDPRVAPEGYLLRTNYSFTGAAHKGAGYIRFDRASLLFHRAVASGGISHRWLLTTASRDMVNGLTGDDPLAGTLPAHAGDQRFVYASDSLVRDSACSTSVFQGVKPGEDPADTVFWARLGHPLTSVALPHWLAAGADLPLTGGDDTPPLVRLALAHRARVFPLEGGSRSRYLDLAPVANRDGTGLLPRLIAVEEEVLGMVDARLASGAGGGTDPVAVQREVEELLRSRLRQLFPEAARAAGLEPAP